MENSILNKVKETEALFENYEIVGSELARLRRLRSKLEERHITVSVIGQFKRGKSALVNRILEREIMPVGIVPVTAVVTTVDYGDEEAEIHFNNGLVQKVEFGNLSTYVNEQENKNNKLNVSKVAIKCPSAFLENGITLVDTPGVGSMHEKNSEEAYAFVKESDAVVFTLSVDSPINQIEIDFLKNAKEYAAKFYFAVNKIDVIDGAELNSYMEYCRGFISGLMEVENVTLFPVSAKDDRGIDRLKKAVTDDLLRESSHILEESASKKLHDIVMSALSQVTFYRNALSMTHGEFDAKFKEMQEFFDAIHVEAVALPESLKENRVVCQAYINDVKNRLTAKVKELFGIDYHYDIADIEGETAVAAGNVSGQVDEICSSLNKTLNAIFMHREENTYVVARRINDLNRLVRKLVKMRDEKIE